MENESSFGPVLIPLLCFVSLVSTPLAMSLEDGTLESSSGFETGTSPVVLLRSTEFCTNAAAFAFAGYLTLDQYRNALPLLGSDSVAFNSPLVGV